QRLVAVTQVGREPARSLRDLPGRPGAVGEVDRLEGVVPPERHRAAPLGVGEARVLKGHDPVLLASGRFGRRARHTPQRGGPAWSDLAAAAKEEAARHDGSTVTAWSPTRQGASGRRSCRGSRAVSYFSLLLAT